MKNTNWITEDWAKGAILCVALGIPSTLIIDLFKSKPIFSTIWQIIKEVWNFVIYILNFNLRVWWLILGIIVIFTIIYLVVKFKQVEVIKPDFLDYKEDKFKQWKWTWSYKSSDSKKAWEISDLTAYCPKCDTPLTDHSSSLNGQSFECPRCNFRVDSYSYDPCESSYKVEKLIWDNIDRKRRNQSM